MYKKQILMLLICSLCISFQSHAETDENTIKPFWRLDFFIESSLLVNSAGITYETNINQKMLININLLANMILSEEMTLVGGSCNAGGSWILSGKNHPVEVKHYRKSQYLYSDYLYANEITSIDYGLESMWGYTDRTEEVSAGTNFTLQALYAYTGFQFHNLFLGISQPWKHIRFWIRGRVGIENKLTPSLEDPSYGFDWNIAAKLRWYYLSLEARYAYGDEWPFWMTVGLHYTFTNSTQYEPVTQ